MNYIPPGMPPLPPPAPLANAYIKPGSAQSPPEPEPTQAPNRGNMSQADLIQVAQRVNCLNNRTAWRAIHKAMAETAPGPGLGDAARAVWAERKALRRAARAAGLPWRPLGKAQIRALRRLSASA